MPLLFRDAKTSEISLCKQECVPSSCRFEAEGHQESESLSQPRSKGSCDDNDLSLELCYHGCGSLAKVNVN